MIGYESISNSIFTANIGLRAYCTITVFIGQNTEQNEKRITVALNQDQVLCKSVYSMICTSTNTNQYHYVIIKS